MFYSESERYGPNLELHWRIVRSYADDRPVNMFMGDFLPYNNIPDTIDQLDIVTYRALNSKAFTFKNAFIVSRNDDGRCYFICREIIAHASNAR